MPFTQNALMADKRDIDNIYTLIDKLFRMSIGETADFTNALYEGDFSLTLEEAQRKKHEYIAGMLGIGKGSRVLDMGCGWGPILNYLREIGAEGIGLTLSDGQAAACRKNGFEVYVKDFRTVTPTDYGTFDAATCVGAMEHICSVKEWKAGKQDEIYRRFFKTAHDLLPSGGRFYVQTMTFHKNMIPYEQFDITADKNSPEYVIALVEKENPGSWLPYTPQQVIEAAGGMFKLIDQSNGRLDYIETIKQWKRRFKRFQLQKYLVYLSMVPRFITDPEFRYQLNILLEDPIRKAFELEMMDHYRFVFEKVT